MLMGKGVISNAHYFLNNFEFDPEMEELLKNSDLQHIEHFFALNVETDLFDPIPQIITKYYMTNPSMLTKIEAMTNEHMDKISLYLAIQYIRSKEFRQSIVENQEKMYLWAYRKLFYTSDHPVVRYGHCGQMGFKSKGIEIAFPIHPKLTLVLRDRKFLLNIVCVITILFM